MGRVAMLGGAERQVEVTEQEIRQQPQMHRQGKKKLRWHTKLGDIAVLEPRYRLESKSVQARSVRRRWKESARSPILPPINSFRLRCG